MTRFPWLTAAVVGTALATPGAAPAQFVGGWAGGRYYNPPYAYPYPFNFRYNYYQQYSATLNTAFGSYNVHYARQFYGPYGLAMQRQLYNQAYLGSLYPSAGYMSGGFANPALAAARNDLGRAQRAAAAASPGKAVVNDQWAYERFGGGIGAVKVGPDAPEAVARAMTTTDEKEIATGDPLNTLLAAAAAAEKKAGKAESAFLPPNLLADLRFAGPKAEAVNLLQRAGRLDFPPAFEQPPLADLREKIDRDFAAVAAPVLIGKAADATRAAKLEADVAEARKAVAPMVHEMSFEDAVAARRLLNQLDATARTLKGPGTAGLIDPAWQTEGTNVAGLVRYMTRFGLRFAPAAPGTEDRYVAVQRGLAAYVSALTEPRKK